MNPGSARKSARIGIQLISQISSAAIAAALLVASMTTATADVCRRECIRVPGGEACRLHCWAPRPPPVPYYYPRPRYAPAPAYRVPPPYYPPSTDDYESTGPSPVGGFFLLVLLVLAIAGVAAMFAEDSSTEDLNKATDDAKAGTLEANNLAEKVQDVTREVDAFIEASSREAYRRGRDST